VSAAVPTRIVALAGGVGGAKLAQGLALTAGADQLAVIVNTADDFDLYGLRICPDLDTVMYTLGGIADPVQGWGVVGDTTRTLEAIAAYGEDPWFKLGDRDFATHILRTARLRAGTPLSAVIADLATPLAIASRILPMSDDPVATIVKTPDGELEFQEYFVGRRQQDEVIGVRFAGIDEATPAPGVLDTITGAEAVIICPSNPFVSVGPILEVAGIRAALQGTTAPIVAVSPIVGGSAIKGPAGKMLASLGHEVSALGVARLYAGLIDGFVIDAQDAAIAPQIESLGMRVLVTEAIMGGPEDRARLAAETLAFAGRMVVAR
jgi:LPPG:FO 2-phospho-L-lactate transferase